jgi:hypothetical protein
MAPALFPLARISEPPTNNNIEDSTMITNRHTRRVDPRWLFAPIKTDGDELFGAWDAGLRDLATDSPNDPDLRDFDEALEQIVFETRKVCSLCGAIVDRGGPVVNREPSDPSRAKILAEKYR